MTKATNQQRILPILFTGVVFGVILLSMLITGFIIWLLFRAGVLNKLAPPRIGTTILWMLCLSTLFGSILALIAGKAPLRPINKLIAAIKALGEGDFSVRLHLKDFQIMKDIADCYNKAATELGKTEMLRADFVNNFSHAFKTPIVSIQGFATLLATADLSAAERQEYLEIIAVESSRLATLATNVLNLSKVENQTILTDQKVYDLSEQIRGAILLLAPKWEEKQLEMAIELPDCSYYGNKDLLGEVWINLLDNAIKFSTVGGKLGVTVFDLGTKLAVTISDTGLGMDQETKQQIFNKFFQGDTSRATAGNGVGLAIVDKVVALHGGTITVESAVGSGSRFEVLLPKRVKPERSMA